MSKIHYSNDLTNELDSETKKQKSFITSEDIQMGHYKKRKSIANLCEWKSEESNFLGTSKELNNFDLTPSPSCQNESSNLHDSNNLNSPAFFLAKAYMLKNGNSNSEVLSGEPRNVKPNINEKGQYDGSIFGKQRSSFENSNVQFQMEDLVNNSRTPSNAPSAHLAALASSFIHQQQHQTHGQCFTTYQMESTDDHNQLSALYAQPTTNSTTQNFMYDNQGNSSSQSGIGSLFPQLGNSTRKLNSNQNNPQHHIKKPLNAFMLFMKEMRAKVVAECTLKESAAINQILGRKWHSLNREEQAKYYEMARKEKELHQQLYPNWSARDNYATHSKRKKKNRGNSLISSSSGSSLGHNNGHGNLNDFMISNDNNSIFKKQQQRGIMYAQGDTKSMMDYHDVLGNFASSAVYSSENSLRFPQFHTENHHQSLHEQNNLMHSANAAHTDNSFGWVHTSSRTNEEERSNSRFTTYTPSGGWYSGPTFHSMANLGMCSPSNISGESQQHSTSEASSSTEFSSAVQQRSLDEVSSLTTSSQPNPQPNQLLEAVTALEYNRQSFIQGLGPSNIQSVASNEEFYNAAAAAALALHQSNCSTLSQQFLSNYQNKFQINNLDTSPGGNQSDGKLSSNLINVPVVNSLGSLVIESENNNNSI